MKVILNYVVGPVLFIAIGYSIYAQIQNLPRLEQHWSHIRQIILEHSKAGLFLTFFLMLVNWGLESKKWHILTNHIQPTSFATALKSVVAGVSFTMLTPNRTGEFLGRVLYLQDGSRVRAATLTFLSSVSQLLITLFAGLAGLALLLQMAPELKSSSEGWTGLLTNALLFGTVLCILFSMLIYFNIGWLIRQLEQFKSFRKYMQYVHAIGEIHYHELLKLLGLSAIRYLVFIWQYVLIFQFFEVGISPAELIISTSVLFLMLAIVPTIALTELGVRGKVSLFIFGLFSVNSLEILAATAGIWLINIIFPAIMGSFLLLTVKIFKKN